jgi:gliding motility-associated-like protein
LKRHYVLQSIDLTVLFTVILSNFICLDGFSLKLIIKYFFLSLIFLSTLLISQNENSKWYFGNQAGLDFMLSPPGTLTNSAMNTTEGCASVANATSGNLLFYTDGSTVWDQTHSTMSNGTGLNAHSSSAQSSLILKKPGSTNLYYVFTQQGQNIGGGGLYYSIVDMGLSAGNGSVTTKNTSLFQPSCEKITATRHCNGVDFWIISHDYGSAVFRTFLLTTAGISTLVVTSTVGTSASNVNLSLGVLKVSSNGKKIAQSLQGNLLSGVFELYDFDNSTGIISNALTLNTTLLSCYGCEFSPDCTKFYGTVSGSNAGLYQWDLCAGTSSAIVASQQTIFTGSPATWFIQLADNGKIYACRGGQTSLGVINSPNSAGTACSYTTGGPSIAPKTSLLGLPNFILSFTKPPTPPFTYTVSQLFGCQTASYNAPPIVQTFTTIGCISSGYSLTGLQWNFGDPASGSANTSTLANPSHSFTALGTYVTQLIVNYSCGGGSDTLTQVVNVNQGCASITSASISCAGLGSATVAALGTGPFSYTWTPSAQNTSVATNLAPGTYTVAIHDAGANTTTSVITTFTSPVPLSGTLNASSSVACQGFTTASANFTGIAGGSGNQNYLWTNGISTYTTAGVNSLGPGIWNVTVTDALTACNFSQTFFISQPPGLVLTLSSTTPTACAGSSVVLTGTASGGTGGYSYQWTSGAATDTFVVSESLAGSHVYTLNSIDANSCPASATIGVNFINNPVLTVSHVSICPLTVGTLTAMGANTYTWNNNAVGATFTDSPLGNQAYTVVGSVSGCTAAASASIILKPVPTPSLNSNSPRCNGDDLTLAASGGSAFIWSGPNSFSSFVQNPAINPVGLTDAGVYTVTVTSINGCTASATGTVIVNPTPTLSVSGNTVCITQTLYLGANAAPGSFYLWTGPNSFLSTQQNPSIASLSLNCSGFYTVTVTGTQGCTNTAVVQGSVVSPPPLTFTLSANSLCAEAFNGSPNTITLTSSGAVTYTINTPYYLTSNNPFSVPSVLSTLPPHQTTVSPATATLLGSNGVCIEARTVTFNIIPNPTLSAVSSTPVICAGKNYTYTVDGADSYTWGPGTPGLNTYTGAVTVASPSVNSVFSVVGESLGCNSPTQVFSITVLPLPTLTIVPGTPAVCLNSKINLVVVGTGTSFTWTPDTGLNTTSGATVQSGPKIQQDYTVAASLNTCTNTAMVTVSVLSLPTPSITVLKPKICMNESLILQGSGGVNYDWMSPPGLIYSGQTVTFTATSGSFEGTYTLTAADENGCKASATTSVIVYPLPQGYLQGTTMDHCIPFCSDFKFISAANSSSLITTSWELNNQFFSKKNFSFCFTHAGKYLITGKLLDTLTGCASTQTFLVNAWPLPIAGFTYFPEKPVENLDEVIFTNTSAGEDLATWNWYFTDNHGYHSAHENTSYLFADAGVYPVAMVVTNKWGCADSAIKIINIEPDFNMYVPNAFTPNEDGRNDIFLPVLRGVKFYNLSIYNRWGTKIFETSDVETGWDGSFSGEPCQDDVYAWKIKVSSHAGEAKEKTGHVTLYR